MDERERIQQQQQWKSSARSHRTGGSTHIGSLLTLFRSTTKKSQITSSMDHVGNGKRTTRSRRKWHVQGVFLLCGIWTVIFWRFFLDYLCSDPTINVSSCNFSIWNRFTQELYKERRYPRVIMYSHDNESTYKKFDDEALLEWKPISRSVRAIGNAKEQRKIRKKDKPIPEIEPETGDCRLRYQWQKSQHPNCNSVHEFAMATPFETTNRIRRKKYKIVGNGYWRDVWIVYESSGEKTVFKSLRFEHDINHRNLDRMRRDALTMERLTSSPYIIDIYSFCGTSSVSEFGDGGDILHRLWDSKEEVPQLEKLHIATQAAIGLAAVHNVDAEGEATIAHTDIQPGQYIKVNGLWKLNDFNRARFISYSIKDKKACPYYVGNNPGRNRAPEEYNYDPQSEMVDVYSLGNIFYTLLQNDLPFHDVSSERAAKLVKRGKRPSIYADIWNSTDPVNQALKEAMLMCHDQDPKERSSAREVENFLKEKMKELDPDRLAEWPRS